MALGLIDKSVLYDIANAIREQNGTATAYLPSAMADAVAALDGSDAGGATAVGLATGTGVISEAVFTGIADAIRGQNGTSTTYKPGEMAAAIRALTWSNLVPRAVYDGDGLLEINYYDTARTSGEFSQTYTQCWEIDPAGYASASAVPWHAIRGEVTAVVIDSSMAEAEIADISHWFRDMPALDAVTGIDYLRGVTACDYLFSSSGRLRSVFTMESDFDSSGITAAAQPFYGCCNLVGGHLAVAANTSSYALLTNGSAGLLTDAADSAADERKWVDAVCYTDGSVWIGGASTDSDAVASARGQVCVNARYKSQDFSCWHAYGAGLTSVHFGDALASASALCMDYWFCGLSAAALTFEGWGNVHPYSMSYLFNGCTALAMLDLSGLDASSCAYWNNAFAGMTALTTIYVDSGWALPASFGNKNTTFYGDTALVGGNGTAYSSAHYNADYAVVDAEGSPGYLTAKE